MVMKICPNCRVRYSVNKYDTDFVHTCDSGNEVLDERDTLDITQHNWNMRGMENKLDGKKSAIEGNDLDELTVRGNKKRLVKTEQHKEYISLEEEK